MVPPPSPTRATAPLQDTVRTAAIPRALFVELIDGLALDLVRPRYRDWVQLQQHCRTRAVVPALMLGAALGVEPTLAKKAATPLGNAWQLTRVLTQIGPDLDRGRIYLPQQDLAPFNVSEIDLVARRLTPGINDLIAFEGDRCQRLFDEGLALLNDLAGHPGASWLRTLLAHRSALLRRVRTEPALALAKEPLTLSFGERLRALRA
jgi:phytoene synthase